MVSFGNISLNDIYNVVRRHSNESDTTRRQFYHSKSYDDIKPFYEMPDHYIEALLYRIPSLDQRIGIIASLSACPECYAIKQEFLKKRNLSETAKLLLAKSMIEDRQIMQKNDGGLAPPIFPPPKIVFVGSHSIKSSSQTVTDFLWQRPCETMP